MNLLIVESPNKVKKIKGWLGSGWQVAASVGHIRDLPAKETGVGPPEFKPKYVIYPEKKKVVDNLRRLSRAAENVYLATDPDREGEAIAWHIMQVLGLKNPKRITFNEITKSAVLAAVSSPRSVDMQLTAAQESRRILDRIVGYEVSPVLSNKSGTRLSAGRVQSPAVKLTVFREKQIREFRSRNYYDVEIIFEDGFKAVLDLKKMTDEDHIYEENIATKIADETDSVLVESVDIKEKNISSRPPFITSSLQQSVSKLFGMSPNDTMKIAQSLFEQGLITYHRTDNPNLSADCFQIVKDYLVSHNFDVQEKQVIYKSAKDAQEAHEAIRPTDVSLDNPCSNENESKIYSLIRERTLASVMAPAVDIVTSILFKSCDKVDAFQKSEYVYYKANGKSEKNPGWRVSLKLEKSSGKDKEVPELFKSGKIFSVDAKVVSRQTVPPSRFTEATLIRALEKLGIGRPSTYAAIMENIKSRNYIKICDKKLIHPTEIGEQLVKSLDSMSFMNFDYTKILEDSLDKISVGKMKYIDLVTSVYNDLISQLQSVEIKYMLKTEKCPKCNESVKKLQSKKKGGGSFWVHFNEDHGCEKYLSDNSGMPVVKPRVDYIEEKCSGCNKRIRRWQRKDRSAFFWTHVDRNHTCRDFIEDQNGSPVFR